MEFVFQVFLHLVKTFEETLHTFLGQSKQLSEKPKTFSSFFLFQLFKILFSWYIRNPLIQMAYLLFQETHILFLLTVYSMLHILCLYISLYSGHMTTLLSFPLVNYYFSFNNMVAKCLWEKI